MAKRQKFQRPTGMRDILPDEQLYFEKIYRTVDGVARFYDFGKIDTPIVEDLELYEKGTGQSTDIVEKQMYTMKTKGGDALAMRPEFTPGIVRAFNEHGMLNLPQPVKLYTYGPLFRYEHPQAGRFRQFHQFDFEVLGEESAAIDAQMKIIDDLENDPPVEFGIAQARRGWATASDVLNTLPLKQFLENLKIIIDL